MNRKPREEAATGSRCGNSANSLKETFKENDQEIYKGRERKARVDQKGLHNNMSKAKR